MFALGKSLWIVVIAALAAPAAGVGLAALIFSADPVPVEPIAYNSLTFHTGASTASVIEAHNIRVASQPPAEQ